MTNQPPLQAKATRKGGSNVKVREHTHPRYLAQPQQQTRLPSNTSPPPHRKQTTNTTYQLLPPFFPFHIFSLTHVSTVGQNATGSVPFASCAFLSSPTSTSSRRFRWSAQDGVGKCTQASGIDRRAWGCDWRGRQKECTWVLPRGLALLVHPQRHMGRPSLPLSSSHIFFFFILFSPQRYRSYCLLIYPFP